MTGHSRRKAWDPGPRAEGDPSRGWLALSDDELLYHVEALHADHDSDRVLLEVVRSPRHFFIRQEAAKKIRDRSLLMEHSADRHIGQILVRGLTRAEDVAYLKRLVRESRHLEVRKAAEVQLKAITNRGEAE